MDPEAREWMENDHEEAVVKHAEKDSRTPRGFTMYDANGGYVAEVPDLGSFQLDNESYNARKAREAKEREARLAEIYKR